MEVEARKCLFKSPETLPSTDIRPRYRKLRMREQALLLASEDLCPLLEKSGLIQEARKVREEVDYLLTPITNIKLTYKDLVSNVTGSVRQEADVESIDQTTSTHQNTSPGIWSTNTVLLQDTVCPSLTNSRPSNTVTTDVLSGGISSTLTPPKISSSTHYHAVVCNSATCLGDRVITTPHSTP